MPPSDAAPTFPTIGINPGPSILEGILNGTLSEVERAGNETEPPVKPIGAVAGKGKKPKVIKPETEDGDALFADWKGLPKSDLTRLPLSMLALPHPACLKSLVFSPFNPPAPHWRQRGHLVYLTAVTLENEAVMIVCTTKGWHVARTTSPSANFDPAPRTNPKEISSHSLIDLLHALSPLFSSTLKSLQGQASNPAFAREPIATVPIPQYPPAYPWLATAPTDSAIKPDLVKTQLAYGYTGAVTPDALEGARDWNEELQNAREMPKGTTQERVLRERILQKTHAEFTAASVRGAMAIARGDLPPINPHEDDKAHMWLTNNIFFTKGVNSVDAYTHLGGDEAARISHAKDAAGVRMMNRLDIDNVYLLGHTVVDWQGERWVCQSVLPGIFSRRKDDADETEDKDEAKPETEKDKEDWVKVNGHSRETSTDQVVPADALTDASTDAENYLIIYGCDSEGGIDKLHWDAGMHKVMAKVASAQRLALHKMKDAKGEEYDFWTSVDIKGLRGSDGRRYLLDLPRLSPVDVEFLQKDVDGKVMATNEESAKEGVAYPHRVVLLRPELLEGYWEHELKLWARKVQAERNQQSKDKAAAEAATETKEDGENKTEEAATDKPAEVASDAETPRFDLRFNADAFVDQPVKADAENGDATFQPSTQIDESDPSIKAVRDASIFLRSVVVPSVVLDVIASNTLGIMDGVSLSRHLHSKGINIRYLGHLMAHIDKYITTSEGEGVGHLKAIVAIVQQEMVFRASKHILRRLVHGQSAQNSACAVSHFLNCLLGSDKNSSPVAEYESLDFQDVAAPAYTQLTPESVRSEIINEVAQRFRWNLDPSYFTETMRKPQLLKELATRIAFQLSQREYEYTGSNEDASAVDADSKAKKGKKGKNATNTFRATTFEPSDILVLLPVVKSAAPSVSISVSKLTCSLLTRSSAGRRCRGDLRGWSNHHRSG
jgi:protein TIF31